MRKNPADDLRVEPAPRHLESRMRPNDIIRWRLGLHKPDLYQRAPSPNNSTFWIRRVDERVGAGTVETRRKENRPYARPPRWRRPSPPCIASDSATRCR